MKKPLIILPFISLLVFMIVSFGFSNPVKKKMSSTMAKKGFALVELFTSEGCSSCPPADEAVAALAKDYPANVFVLCFHVDYWNYLGWKDEFSSADNTNRQQAYAAAFNLTSIYTPEAIINGKTEFTGSDKRKLYASVEQELNNDNHSVIELSAKANGLKAIVVSYKANADNKSMLQVALVQLQAVSAVKRGENKGKELHHINVVRNFKTVAAAEGSVSISIPEGLSAGECKIIAFMQNRSDMHISAAAECMIVK
jgi:hypothetical protein